MKKSQLRKTIRESIKKIMNEQEENNWQGGDIGCTSMLPSTDPACVKCSSHFAAGSPSPFIGFGANNSGPNCECCDIEITDDPTGDNPCITDSNWLGMPDGGTAGNPGYSYFKNDYCDRCAAGNQAFPVVWNNPSVPSGGWFYDPSNGTDYCQCCKDQGTSTSTGDDGDIPLEDLPCKDLIAQDPTAHAACCKKCKGKGMLQNDPCFAHCKCCKSPIKKDPKGNIATKKAIKEMYKAFSKLKK
tara:strand:+ start:3268 stop:3996 length:729 start_codon:yes stop_codon:yes gene_type:complete